jgi:hypothetical protein
MPKNRDASDVLNREFLEIRARILDLAAALDRIERAPTPASGPDQRLQQLRQGIELLLAERPNRAEAVQLHFSYEYDPSWRERFGVVGPRLG